MAGLNLFTNNAATTLASGVLIGDTSLTVAAGTGAEFPTLTGSEYFYCTIANNAGSVEIIKVTARSTDTFTIVRGQDGTSAAAWSSGDKVELRLTRIDLLNFPQLDSTNTFAAVQTFTVNPLMNGLTASKPVFTDASKNLTSTGTVAVDQGGTGQTSYTNGELLIGNTTGNTLTKTTLTAGTGISVTNGTGSITIANTLSGGFTNMQVFTSTGTFTVPTGITKVKVTVVGGGGNGGTGAGAGGGGAGGAAIEIISGLTPGGTETVTVGGVGGTSSFGVFCSATGGATGGGLNAAGGDAGIGSGGDLNLRGGAGGVGLGGISTGGFAGASILGGEGKQSVGAAAAGAALANSGSGGSGRSASSGSGGAGAAGIVIVEY